MTPFVVVIDPPVGPVMVGGVNCPVEIPPTVLSPPRVKILMPICSDLLRSTLAKRTLSRICGSDAGTLTLRRFTTLPPVLAIFTAREELSRSLTVPRRKMLPFSILTFRGCPGSSVRSSRRIESRLSFNAVALARTVTLKNCRPPCVSQTIRLVSPGVLPFTMISVGPVPWTSAISLMPMETRLIGHVVSTSTVFPTATERSFAES